MCKLMSRSLKSAIVSLFSTAAVLITGAAYADPQACVTTHATGQREAKAGRLRFAMQLFTNCGSDESCPNELRAECAELLKTVQQTIPTVIFSILDEKNGDISAAKVFSTDELIIDGLDGRAIPVDPGKHRLRFLLPWGAVLSSDVLIREGEKNRLIQVKLGAEEDTGDRTAKDSKQTASSAAAPPPPPVPAAAVTTSRGPSTGAWIAMATSVVGLGVGTTFAIVGSSKKSDLDACSPSCGSDMRPTYDALKRDYLIADIGFVVGVASAGVATWLILDPNGKKHETDKGSAARLTLFSVRPVAFALPGGGAVAVSGGF